MVERKIMIGHEKWTFKLIYKKTDSGEVNNHLQQLGEEPESEYASGDNWGFQCEDRKKRRKSGMERKLKGKEIKR